MSKNVKTAVSIQCPLVVGQNAVFSVEVGKTAQSVITSILEVRYQSSDQSLRVTFETQNSIYENVPIFVKSMPFYVEQSVTRGSTVTALDYGPIFVEEIVAITEINNIFNLIIKDSQGIIFSCPFLKP